MDPGVTGWESCPTRTALHDSVDSCMTNHRIIREHAGGSLRRSWHTLLARGRGRQLPAPPRAQRQGDIWLIARHRDPTGGRGGTARRVVRRVDRVNNPTGVSPPRFREPSRGAGVSAAIPACGMVPTWPSRVRECSLAATLPGELSGPVF